MDGFGGENTGREWVSDEDLRRLERNTFGSGPGAETSMGTAQRLFEENAIDAAITIIRVAKSGSSETVRFNAAKYVVERAMGPVASAGGTGGPGSKNAAGDDALLAFAKQITGTTASTNK